MCKYQYMEFQNVVLACVIGYHTERLIIDSKIEKHQQQVYTLIRMKGVKFHHSNNEETNFSVNCICEMSREFKEKNPKNNTKPEDERLNTEKAFDV